MPPSAPFLGVELNTLDDFFRPGAPLVIQHVEAVRLHLRELAVLLRETGVAALAGLDAHEPEDAEFTEENLPPHALLNTPGRYRLGETLEPGAPIIPASGQRRPWPKVQEIRERGGQLILEKRRFDLFSNPACGELLKALAPRELLLYGATLEHDIRATALSARLYSFSVTVVDDACGARDPVAAAKARAEMEARGVCFEQTAAVARRLTHWKQREEARLRARRASEETAP